MCSPVAHLGWASAVEALETVTDCSRQTRVPAPPGHVWRERAANAYLVPKPDRGVTRRTATESEMRHTAAIRLVVSPGLARDGGW